MAVADDEGAAAGALDEWDTFSDESSFYGDEEVRIRWEDYVEEFEEQEYWGEIHDKLINVIAYKARPTTTVHLKDGSDHLQQTLNSVNGARIKEDSNSNVRDICSASSRNPHEGWRNSKQFDESVSDFLKRAPPLDSLWSSDGWLWIANPHAKASDFKSEVKLFTSIGSQYLDDFTQQRHLLEEKHPDKAAGTITRMLGSARDKLKANIEQLAATHHVVHGKWMLFPHVDIVQQTWRAIVEAVTENRLGDMAKIATGSNKDPDDGLRVICIYTQDFTNTDDVKRVCRAIHDLGLISPDRGIFYKADAYTYLDITSNNPYKLQASLYASRDVLANANLGKGTKRAAPAQMTESTKGKEPVRKKQATLDWSF